MTYTAFTYKLPILVSEMITRIIREPLNILAPIRNITIQPKQWADATITTTILNRIKKLREMIAEDKITPSTTNKKHQQIKDVSKEADTDKKHKIIIHHN